jgi:hypothetical protein
MVKRQTVTPAGDVIGWIPGQDCLTGPDGTVWAPAPPKHLSEDTARKLVRRTSTRVARSNAPPPSSWRDQGGNRLILATEIC